MKGILTFRNSSGRVIREFEVAKLPIHIGRAANCEVTLDSPKISKHHFVVQSKNGHLVATDLGSANGLTLKDVRVEEVNIESDPIFSVGDIVVEFREASFEDHTVVVGANKPHLHSQVANSNSNALPSSPEEDDGSATIVRPRHTIPHLRLDQTDPQFKMHGSAIEPKHIRPAPRPKSRGGSLQSLLHNVTHNMTWFLLKFGFDFSYFSKGIKKAHLRVFAVAIILLCALAIIVPSVFKFAIPVNKSEYSWYYDPPFYVPYFGKNEVTQEQFLSEIDSLFESSSLSNHPQ